MLDPMELRIPTASRNNTKAQVLLVATSLWDWKSYTLPVEIAPSVIEF